MATGREHSAGTLGLAAGLGIGYFLGYAIDPVTIPALILGSAFSGFLVSPDLDVDGGNISNYYIRKSFGTDVFWNIFWRPYRIGKKHRGLSHIPLLSTLFRLAYVLCPLIILLFKDQDTPAYKLGLTALVSSLFSLPLIFIIISLSVQNYWIYIVVFVLGAILADVLHIVMDQLF